MRLGILTMAAVWCTVQPLAYAQMADKAQAAPADMRAVVQRPASECAPDGIAVGGYDLITYRSDAEPRFGSDGIAVEHDGLRYLFETTANRDVFRADPERYLPAYSGWCAVTLALGRLVCPDYTNFKIEDDRLLLFEVTGFTNGQTLWNSDPGRFRNLADDNYTLIMAPE